MMARTERVGDIYDRSLWGFFTKWLKSGFLSPPSSLKCEDTFPGRRADRRSVGGGGPAAHPLNPLLPPSRSSDASSQAEKRAAFTGNGRRQPGPASRDKVFSGKKCYRHKSVFLVVSLFPRYRHQTSPSKLTWAVPPSEHGRATSPLAVRPASRRANRAGQTGWWPRSDGGGSSSCPSGSGPVHHLG